MAKETQSVRIERSDIRSDGDYESTSIKKVHKGGFAPESLTLSASGTNTGTTASIDMSGYREAVVTVEITGGTWTVQAKSAPVDGAASTFSQSYGKNYGSGPVKNEITGITANGTYTFEGLSKWLRYTAICTVGSGTITFKSVPLN